MRKIVKEIVAPTGDRKVEIFERLDGTYGFTELKFSAERLELSWIPVGRRSSCYARDARRAENEARGRVDWLGARGERR